MVPEVRYAKSGDVHIAYQVVGDGPIDLVWIPGFISHGELMWEMPEYERFMKRLASFSRLILFDKRGTGLSDRAMELPGLDGMMDDLAAVLDATGSETATLVGYSEGGPLSLLFTATHPQRVSSLVLYGTFARTLRAPDFPPGLPREMLEAFASYIAEGYGTGRMIDIFAPSIAQDQHQRRVWGHFERQAGSPGAIGALLKMYADIDVRPVLDTITAPVLVLHRKDDPAVPIEHARYIAERIRGARLVEVEGNDHVPFFGDWEAIVGEMEEFLTGERTQPDADRVLGTVMFTDIVGSTERASQLGDREWRALLDAHNRAMRDQLRRFGGREVKTTGDGFLAMFDRPARAIRCAIEAQRSVRALGIDIRAGLHTGECDLIGDDVGGIAVHIASRVAGLAGPGEVVVSSTVKDLVAGSGIAFEARGTHALKGIPDEWHLYTVAN